MSAAARSVRGCACRGRGSGTPLRFLAGLFREDAGLLAAPGSDGHLRRVGALRSSQRTQFGNRCRQVARSGTLAFEFA
ncbi:MAG TPA: hypothetical protein DEP66_01910 [Acidimicrobiaceae bacterium]|nr:hypothetical protein [Acidimicrobiaceae bacterium]HCB36989.1 hypothetical protein [Acidimicrobiaceae bacterium]